MLNGGKDVELRVWRKGDPERSDKYTHVLLRMVQRLREMISLEHLSLIDINVIARLGERLGPFDNAKEVIRVAEAKGWKIGMGEAELIKFMSGTRKVDGPGRFQEWQVRRTISALRDAVPLGRNSSDFPLRCQRLFP